MKWSKEAWYATLPVYNNILEMPFISELMDGTLDNRKFVFYIQQDALYLAEYGKVLAGIASKLENSTHIESFLHFAGDTMSVEKELHKTFMDADDNINGLEASPSCLLYTSHLHKQLANKSIEVALATVLPCFWIYKKVGDHILKNQSKGKNPYQDWIDTYGGEDFNKAVLKAISICDEIADRCTNEQREEMTRAFVMCSKMEWMFWDSAYRMEKWPV